MEQSEKTLDMIVNLCKNRGYVFPGSEIYGGLANSWDYGPLGVEFKNNVKKAWLKKFVQESPYNVGLDAAIIMNPQTWVTTGHVSSFSDPLLDCRACKARHRADKLIGEEHPEVNVDAMSFDEMDAFLEKATIFNEDGTTKRYGTVFGGWDYWYYEMLYKNNGVETVTADGTTDVNSAKSVEITTKIKEWIDKGYAYYAYGTNASTNMRQLFWDGGAFSVFHTSSMYDTYLTNVAASADPFEVGMAWLPGGSDGESFKSEVGGSAILIPAAASQAEKNAAWQFMMFMTSPEINLYWADKTGYFPTRASVQGTPEYEEYLSRKPAMADVVSMSSWINPRNQNPAYDACANLWRHALAQIFNEGAPIQETLDALAVEIQETLDDQ